LAIIGTESPQAQQPIVLPRGMLTFNGEIYNFLDLARALRDENRTIDETSDSMVLAACMSHWGLDKTLRRIDGMFAFAWYDAGSRTTYLVRDRLGEKPLYWSKTRDRVWFASEIKALLATTEVDHAPNLRRIDDFLYTAKINGAETIFRDVQDVEPGTIVRIDHDGQIGIRRYWSLEGAFEEPSVTADILPVSDFTERLRRAVASRSISDVPFGVLLSGGIDSNAVADLLLSENVATRFPGYFADNVDEGVSERNDVEEFLGAMRRRHPEGRVDLKSSVLHIDDYLEKLNDLAWFYDEPVQFYNSPLLSGLCAVARRDDVKVLLSGEGSDELLHGYDRFARTSAELANVTDRDRKIGHLYFGGGLHSAPIVERLTRHVADGAKATAPWRWLEKYIDAPLDILQLVFSQRYRMQMLLQRQDRVGMAHSVEIRVPFLQPAFVDWVNRLSTAVKFDAPSGETKVILRRAMADRLPRRILTKAKDGFPSDMMVWLRDETMRRLTRELTGDPTVFTQSYLDGAFAKTLVDDHFNGVVRQDVLIWNLVSLEIWYRQFHNSVSLRAPHSDM